MPPDTPEQIDEDTAKEIQEDIEEADEDVTREMRLTAGIQLFLFFAGIIGAIALAVTTGIISPSLVVNATINIGWIVEYLVIAVVAIFIIYLTTLLLIVMPGSIMNFFAGLAYGAAVAAGFVDEDNNENTK
jgi:branched-subunit amino acid transport protein